LVEIELSVKFSPPFANTFSVSGNLMDKYNFYKSLYDRELNRRNDLDASINLPLTIIGILITTNAYLAKNLFPLESICKMNYRHILMTITFLVIIFSVFYLTKSYNNFFKGFRYRNIGNYLELRKHELNVSEYNVKTADVKKNIDFDNQVLEKIISIAENHCAYNDKRSYDLYIAKTSIFFIIIFTIINYIFIGAIK